MREIRQSGSVRGVWRNPYPYRDERVGRSGGGADGMRPPAAEKGWLAGFRQFRFCFLLLFRSRCFKGGKNDG
jgi:hypothetical protein